MPDPAPLFQSSGDLIADRRYEYARALIAEGDRIGALDLLAQTLERAPGFTAAWFTLGEVREAMGNPAPAIEAYTQALALDPQDRHGAALRLARLGVRRPGAAMSPAYVRALFDQYAPRFDRTLTENLAYRGPQLLFEAVFEACETIGRERWFDRAFDLGCGTGLAGKAFRGRIDSIVGVDLSPAMIAQAERLGCYNHLHVADMLAFLRTQGIDSADLVIAADALVYVEDVAPLFAECARTLERHGVFAFTVETHAGEGVRLGEKLRYAHAARHIDDALAAAGLDRVILREASTREEAGAPVPGLVVVAEQRRRPLPSLEG